MEWQLTLGSLVAYIAGLILLFKIAPTLVKYTFDNPLFIVVSAVAILGAMLAFGAVAVTDLTFNDNLAVRSLDVFLLLILLIATIRLSRGAFRPRYGIGVGTDRVARVLAGSFFLVLAIGAICLLVLLFVPSR